MFEYGVVKKYFSDRGFGYITVKGQSDIFFRINKVQTSTGNITEGTKVKVDTEPSKKGGLQAKTVMILDTFHNPYNFVRPLNIPDIESEVTRKAAPSHIKLSGQSGVIKATISTKSPFCIIGKEVDEVSLDDSKTHKTYDFYKTGNKYIVPGSSVRGSIRSIFEAITNSCFSILSENDKDEHNRPLFYRGEMGESNKIIPAKVIYDKKTNTYQAELFTGHVKDPDVEKNLQYAAWVFKYGTAGKKKDNAKKNISYNEEYKKRFIDKPSDRMKLSHGQKVYAKLEEIKYNKQTQRNPITFTFYSVKEFSTTPKKDYIEGYYFESGYEGDRNADNKHDERFFYRISNKCKKIKEKLPIDDVVIQKYNALLTNYVKTNWDKEEKNLNLKAGNSKHSRHIQQKEKALNKDKPNFVYVKVSKDYKQIEAIYPVMMSRTQYKYSVLDLLDSSLHHCKEYDKLCPACRLFGWVKSEKLYPEAVQNNENSEQLEDKHKKSDSYKGRVRFSDAELKSFNSFPKRYILKPLGEPSPTAIPLYLYDSNSVEDLSNYIHAYNEKHLTLRGRKMYLDHGKQGKSKHYELLDTKNSIEKTNLNRTITAFDPGTEFTFSIEFQQLRDIELGALLWALELEPDIYHHFGYAKPFGMGKVKVNIENISLNTPIKDSYLKWDSPGLKIVNLKEKDYYVSIFKKELEKIYGKAFEELENYKDLSSILSPKVKNDIMYPPGQEDIKKSYQWFQKNKKWNGKKKASEYKNVLPLASSISDDSGFPKKF
ncbi:TIGR03986 family CRISPR-associated RAMP protein [Bacillus sp. 165]|uniref:TIGR03986 family type III CRISPR-associated RAMP protein n=1 Tax=Bacillus sp. 165 TaxID=1529117 RepID=UPI001ADC2990|nr:TIGR03986 family CRISPR-associated RAMP protein [Bacillus sp. 165]MBO9129095.1 TIGR03986 family CRISPR-associated RAMP protein [Bacillus sp. 165]